MINKFKFTKKESSIAKHVIIQIIKNLKTQHPKLKMVDSNLVHLIVYDVAEKCRLPITRGWFKNGKYCPVVDDILIKMNVMDKSQHQMYGNEIPMEKMIECECHKASKRMKSYSLKTMEEVRTCK